MSFAAITAGTAAVGVGLSAASSLGAFGGGQAGAGAGTANFPQYNGEFNPIPNVNYNPAQIGADLNAVYPALQKAAGQATAYSNKQREKILPGSGQMFNQAGNVLNSWLQGQIPQDVVDQTQRRVAESFGGAWNPYTQGGQAGSAFARSIGQTSFGIQQQGISAAPTWQQLAQSFVTMPQEFAPLAGTLASNRYSYDALNTGINQYNEEGRLGVLANQYQAAQNQYGANQLAGYQQQQAGQNLANTLGGTASALGSIGGSYFGNTGSVPTARPTAFLDPASGSWRNDMGASRTAKYFGLPAVSAYNLGRT